MKWIKLKINDILDKRDNSKKLKALSKWPYKYIDRHGVRWFNCDYWASWTVMRKFC